MENIYFKKEWEFIIAETHKKFKKTDLLKREVLFTLQILLSKSELENYSRLKRIYCKN